MLKVGDQVFISGYGAGIVIEIDYKKFLDINQKYIIIYLIVDDMDLLIPECKISSYKIREVVDKNILESALNLIKQEAGIIELNWSKRYRKNKSKIAKGDIFEMCEVIRDLKTLKDKGVLPLGEEKILDKAIKMVVSETMLLLGISEADARSLIINNE